MKDGGVSEEIGILLYPGAQLAAVHGLTDLFGLASRFHSAANCGSGLRVTHWAPRGDSITCIDGRAEGTLPRPSVLILPPTLDELPDAETTAVIERWLIRQHATGVRLATICSGVFLVAGTGLLDGRAASTHRICAQALAESFPNISVDAQARIIEHPDILTAGGFMAWVDVGLVLVGRLLGNTVREQTARFVLSQDGHVGMAGRTAHFSPQAHADPAMQRALDLIHLHDGQGLTLQGMAQTARLERRTFLRRFTVATGARPMEYCRAVRLARARELLEAGNMPLKKISESLGYSDVSTFARFFHRSTGTAPASYRRAFVSAAFVAPLTQGMTRHEAAQPLEAASTSG